MQDDIVYFSESIKTANERRNLGESCGNQCHRVRRFDVFAVTSTTTWDNACHGVSSKHNLSDDSRRQQWGTADAEIKVPSGGVPRAFKGFLSEHPGVGQNIALQA